jgi:hypothetical protein
MNNSTGATKHTLIVHKNRLNIHDSNVRFLDTLAILSGCKEHINTSLPDGRRPDVIRVNTKRRLLFIGEGKNTESPGCLNTQERLWVYLRWLSAHLYREDSVGILAICFKKEYDNNKWVETITSLSRDMNLLCFDYGTVKFGSGVNVVWFLFHNCNQTLNNKIEGEVL